MNEPIRYPSSHPQTELVINRWLLDDDSNDVDLEIDGCGCGCAGCACGCGCSCGGCGCGCSCSSCGSCGCSCGSEETNSGDSRTPEEVAESHGIEVKQGENAADISSISDEIVSTMSQVVAVFDTHARGEDVVITSGTDGTHREGSAHYSGNALDFRANHISDEQAQAIADELNARLGDDYDVIFERKDTDQVGEDEWSDHIHVEYDPD